jgi:multidrug efflux pump subunit AcrB
MNMHSLFRFFTQNWRFSTVIVVIVVLSGIFGLTLMRRESIPPVNFASVAIAAIYPGASPEEVQDRVTRVIENELRGISGIKDLRSVSGPERSEIDVRINIDGVDSKRVVNDIQTAVQRAAARLPPELPDAPVVLEIKADEIPVLELALVGPNENRQRDVLAQKLKRTIEDATGISTVRLAGYREREFQVLLDPVKMNRYQVGLAEVTAAVSSRVRNVPAGFVRSKKEVSQVRVIGQVTSPSELGNIVVRSNDRSNTIRVKDLARTIEGNEDAKILARFNGEPATLLSATKKGDADALRTLGRVYDAIAEFKKTAPPEFKVQIYNDEGVRIQNRLDIVVNNTAFGLITVLLILFLFLPGKIGLCSSASLPICILGTIALMVAAGANFNVITMLALIICLGNLVDNSVVMSENYTRLREEGVKAEDAAVKSAEQFWIPFTASTITIIAAFLPMLVTKGVLGQFISWIPIVVTVALLFSLFEALFLLPSRLQFFDPPPSKARESWFTKIEDRFGDFVGWTIERKYLTVSAILGVLLGGVLLTGLFNRFELFPDEGNEYYVARFEGPKKMSIEESDRLSEVVSRSVLEVLDPKDLTAVIGRAGVQQTDPSDPSTKNGESVGMLIIGLTAEASLRLSSSEVLVALRKIKKPAELETLSFEPIRNGPPVGKPLTLTLRSSNYEQLRTLATKTIEFVKTVPGALDVQDDEINGMREWAFRYQDSEASFSGLGLDTVGLNLRTVLQGLPVAQLTQDGTEFDVRVRFDDTNRSDIALLRDTKLLNPRGNLIPLRLVGQFEEQMSPSTRKNFDYKQAITVTADVDKSIITATGLNAKARAFLLGLSKEFPDVTPRYGGEEESTNESLSSLGFALVLALVGIFATLVFTFQSFSKPFLILSSIPLGIVGVLYSFTLTQRPLSFLAFIGVVGLSGVVINSAIILVDYIEELRKGPEGSKDLGKLLVFASSRRLRAVLATGLTTVVGLIPSAFGIGGSDPILVPMTLALSWGMIVGTVLALVWIPAAYLILEDVRSFFVRLSGFSR